MELAFILAMHANAAPTSSQRRNMECERYFAAAIGLLLMILLVLGTAAYAGVHALLSPRSTVVVESRKASAVREADTDPLVTLDAVVLAMIAVLAAFGTANARLKLVR